MSAKISNYSWNKYNICKDYNYFALYNPVSKGYLIAKSHGKINYKIKQLFKNDDIKIMFKDVKPIIISLETDYVTQSFAFTVELMWIRIFHQQGYKVLNKQVLIEMSYDLWEEQMQIFEAKNNFFESLVFDGKEENKMLFNSEKKIEAAKSNTVTIRMIRDLISNHKIVFIRPSGRREYYFGKVSDIPVDLLDATVLELPTYAYYDESGEIRYRVEIGFIIDPVEKYDRLFDIEEAEEKQLKMKER